MYERMYVCMYVLCMYVRMYVRMHVCIMYICMNVCYVCIMFVYTRVCVCVCKIIGAWFRFSANEKINILFLLTCVILLRNNTFVS